MKQNQPSPCADEGATSWDNYEGRRSRRNKVSTNRRKPNFFLQNIKTNRKSNNKLQMQQAAAASEAM